MNKTRILLLDDHAMFRQGMELLLNAEPDLELKLHCASVGEALVAVASGLVDIVVLDVNLGAERGIDFLAQARANGFQGPVLVLTAGLSAHEEELLRRRGISGVLVKDRSVEAVAERIREAVGRVQRPQPVAPAFDAARSPFFSPREAEVLRLVVEGRLNKEIAAKLECTEATIKATVRQLFRKTGAQNRSQLVRVALEEHHDQI